MTLINERVYIEKKAGFDIEAAELLHELKESLKIDLTSLRIILTYDVFGISSEDLEKAKKTVFSEVMVDCLLDDLALKRPYLAIETLPGQYDQRADSAMQCVRLLNPNSSCTITTGKIVLFEGLSDESALEKIKAYLINPIESREKQMEYLEVDQNVEVRALASYEGFIKYDLEELGLFLKNESLAMTLEDLILVQAYFRKEQRDPKETEIKVLDTYWSDHCRHTTFETSLKDVKITTKRFNEEINQAYERYLKLRSDLKRTEKPMTLMDLATINSRYLRSRQLLNDVEISDEINACSVFIDVDHHGKNEKWLLQFKNETHNHPTEIEPFGGASTCIGGAIRDPLSGRSFVYQAMRISGSGDIRTTLDNTMKGKLAQRVISKKSAHGNSSYGNQIGLATTFVKEIYYPNYVAKHMEVGAVVGAVKAEAVRREKPEAGDVVILLGGRTGRDGIGGATGSSKQHTQSSLDTCASEVQKGNAPEERKIQRLFRNPKCTALIKKCNDFGAGGVCVAIGELADGLEIQLDQVRLKYAGLNATEIAISESQERMAVVVSAIDAPQFIEFAEAENLEAYQVATVTDTNRLIMKLNGQEVVNLSRSFLDTAGARQEVSVSIETSTHENPFIEKEMTKDTILATLQDLNVACQKGLVEMFDASIGSASVHMPFGGKDQLSPTIASISKIPVLDGKTKTCSILTYGFNPKIMEYSCFVGAMYSVLDSMAKTVAVGGQVSTIYFSFQEYFERLNADPHRWGKVLETLLGAMHVQDYFDKAAIGGKDSMSGSFNELDVPPTFISFACSKGHIDRIVSSDLKLKNSTIGLFLPKIERTGYPDLSSYDEMFKAVENLSAKGELLSSSTTEEGGIMAALVKMSLGNKVGLNIQTQLNLLKLIPGAIIVETMQPINHPLYVQLGHTTDENYSFNQINLSYEEVRRAWLRTMDEFYPRLAKIKQEGEIATLAYHSATRKKASIKVENPKVCIPVFPGTNCEYDTKRAFEDEGAVGQFIIFRNQTEEDVKNSIKALVDELDQSHILALSGGFSSGDEPDGSAKFIVNVLQNDLVKAAIHRLLAREGLIIGICNGFQALIKSGLLPYGAISTLNDHDATLYRNDIHRHVSKMVHTKVCSNHSPWLQDLSVGEDHMIAISHGEGKFVCNEVQLNELKANGQIAFQYVGDDLNASNCTSINPNGSVLAVEGIVSACGQILGKMGHSERYVEGVFQNIPGNKKQSIFASGVNYFRKD